MSNLEEKACEMVHDAMIHDDDYEAQAIHHAKNTITNARAGIGLSIALMICWLVWPEAIGAHLALMVATILMVWSTHNETRQMKRYAQMYRNVLDRKNVGRWDAVRRVLRPHPRLRHRRDTVPRDTQVP